VAAFDDYVQYVNLVLYTVVAVFAVRQWTRHRERAALWAAVTFVALAIVVDIGRLVPDDSSAAWATVAERLLIGLLVLFPYFLYRFTLAFNRPSNRLELLVAAMTAIVLLWTFFLPELPDEGEPRPAWFTAYVIAFTVHWTVLTIVVTYRLWVAGRREPSVARRRMRLLSFAAAAITIALIIAVSAPSDEDAVALVTGLITTVAALTFLVGLAPPPFLRLIWRRPEQERVQLAIQDLMSATTGKEVVARVLPGMAQIVGARALELRSGDGDILGTYGMTSAEDARTIHVPMPEGEIVLWTSPYAPFFGGEEIRTLATLGALTAVALDRSRLFAQERDARLALERADEIKTNFIALASHELRTPVATIHGLVDTINARRADLRAEQIVELEVVLGEQTARLRQLVDQLLDLSRLDADAVEIEPQSVEVRRRLEELVAASAGSRASEIELSVPGDLEAEVDPDAFDRIASNLIVNALRYGSPPVRVTAQQTDRHFRLTVEDRGAGVSPEFVPSLFERFTRSRESKEQGGGTGLGLAIARSYALAHHGELIYEPARPNGARFQFVLPVSARERTA
jgi:signal transduction histidine kinase